MRGVILAGGTGSRLLPLTRAVNKHLLPVGDRPMLLHAVDKLRGAGIVEICVISGREHLGDIITLLGSGADYGCDFTYRVQDSAGGIAHALALAEDFARGGRICVILGDNIFADSLDDAVSSYAEQPKGARVMLKRVDDPQRFGVARLDGDRVVEILEKPDTPPSDLAVTGIYFYDAQVFDVIRGVRPSARGELEITDVNNVYIDRDEMTFGRFEGWWTDAGTFLSYHLASRLAAEDDGV